jgi:hypothetical protein
MVAIDRGRSAIKIAWPGGRAEWPPLTERLPGPPPAALVGDGTGPQRGAWARVGSDEWWALGEAARGGLHQDERKATPDARALAAAVAVLAGYRHGQVDVGLAVPAGLAGTDAERLARIVAGHVEVEVQGAGRGDMWLRAHVLPEPAAALLAVVLDADGRPDPEGLRATWAVADMGHRTLDIAALRGGRVLWSRSTPSGGLVAYETWIREVVEPGLGVLLTDGERATIVEAVASGYLPTVRGIVLPRDMLVGLEQHRAALAERVVMDLRNALAGEAYDRLFLAGGLARWLGEELRREYPYAVVPPEPRWAVAEGLLRYLAYRSVRDRQAVHA